MATGRIGVTPNLGIRWSKVPTGGTTSLSGNDDNSVPLAYSAGYEAVYRNGVLLSRGNDYTATNGTSITLVDATITGDLIEVFANQTVALTDTYSQSAANAKFINNTLTTTTGDIIYASAANTPARLGIGSTDQVLKVSSGIPAWGAAPSPSFVGCIAYGAVNLSFNTTATVLSSLTSEIVDTNGFHSTSTNTERMTIPSGYDGKYLLQLDTNLASTASMQNIYLRVRKNGSNITEGLVNGNLATFTVGQAQDGHFNASVLVTAVAGDYFDFTLQTGGSSSTTDKVRYSIAYLGA